MKKPIPEIIALVLLLTGVVIAAVKDIERLNRTPNILECPRPKICQKVEQ